MTFFKEKNISWDGTFIDRVEELMAIKKVFLSFQGYSEIQGPEC